MGDWKRTVSRLRKLSAAWGSGNPGLSPKQLHCSSVLFSCSLPRLFNNSIRDRFSLNSCNFNGCRRLRQNFLSCFLRTEVNSAPEVMLFGRSTMHATKQGKHSSVQLAVRLTED